MCRAPCVERHSLAERGDDSELHIIIFDEIDSVCKQRGSSRDGTGVGDTVVNQLLSKIDGVNSLNNILVIGMTCAHACSPCCKPRCQLCGPRAAQPSPRPRPPPLRVMVGSSRASLRLGS
jgi:hypothetical protein